MSTFRTVDIIDGNKVIHKSKNLRGLLDFARKHPIDEIHLIEKPDKSGALGVHFENGCYCYAKFADFTVMCEWVLNRISWYGNRVGPLVYVNDYYKFDLSIFPHSKNKIKEFLKSIQPKS